MIKQFKNYWSAWLLLFGLAGCAVTDIDRTVSFEKFRTYSWGTSEVNAENPIYRGELVDKKIKDLVNEEFRRAGIVRDDSDPDFLVSYKTYTEKKETVAGPMFSPFFYRSFYPFPFAMYPYGYMIMPYPYHYPYPRTSTFTEGTLVIDITDAASKEVVWRGYVKGSLDQSANLEKLLTKGVKAILKKYPMMQNAIEEKQKTIV